MNKDEILDKLKGIINSLIKDNPEDPENAAAGHADAATADLHDVIAAKMRERIAGTQEAPEPEVTPASPEVTPAPPAEAE